jgi:PAS domain S-box-containing protein
MKHFAHHLKILDSLQNRLILLAGVSAIVGIWFLASLSSNAYQSDLEQQVLAQQSQTLSILAAEIDQEVEDRIKMLESTAARITPLMFTHPSAAQALLNDRHHMPQQFPGGYYLVNSDAVIVASVPTSLAQAGLAYQPDKAMLTQLREGKSVVSKAVYGKRLNSGVFGIASPVRDQQGNTIGALVGTMSLGQGSFLNRVTASSPNAVTRFRLVSPLYRQIIMATDPVLNLQKLPSAGIDAVLDQLLDGSLSTVRLHDANGREMLVSTARISSTGWILVGEQSVSDAFSASSQLRLKVWFWGFLVASLVLALNTWFIRRQLSPMNRAAKALLEVKNRGLGWRQLPTTDRKDEVARLISGFNEVLNHLFERETELKESEYRWRFAIEGSGDGVWDCDLENGSVFFSRRWKELIGYGEFEISDSISEWKERLHPDDRTHALSNWNDYLSGAKASYLSVHRLRGKDGNYRWILSRGMTVKRSPAGAPLRVIGTHTDLTERKEAEIALRTLATSLEEAQRIAKVGSWELDIPTGALKWSAEIFRLFELDPSQFEATYEGFLNAIHPDDQQSVNLAYAHSLELRTDYEITHRLLMQDGRVKWVLERCVTDFDKNGTPLRSRGTVQDITANYLKDRELEASRDLLMTIINTVPTRVFWKDQDLVYMGCNQRFADDAGKFSPADVVGRNDFEMGWQAQAELYREDDFKVLSSGRAKLSYDEPQNTPNGQTIWLRTSKVPLRNAEGEIFGILGVYEDITARKMTELDLNRHREQLEELVQQKTAALERSAKETQQALDLLKQQKYVLDEHTIVTMSDMTGRITYANRKFFEVSGYSAAEVMGKDHFILNSGVHPKGFFKDMFDTVATGRPWHAEVCNKRKDGSLFWVDTTVALFNDSSGKPLEYIAVRTDITVRKNAEEVAYAASRAKTEFLANMSHEIRTPMNGVLGMVDQLKHTQLSHEQRGMLNTINRSSLALLNILNDILDITKIEADQLKVEFIPTHLRDVVESTVLLMRSTPQNKEAQVCLFIDPTIPDWILSDPTRLRQILFNLVGNAFKFTDKQKSRIKIEITPLLKPDGVTQLEIRIADNGIGMDSELISKLFKPFTQGDVSTARKFGGTGLGLSITRHLVHLLNGDIQVSSALGEGSAFTIQLPLNTTDKPLTEEFENMPNLSTISVIAVVTTPDVSRLLAAYLSKAGAKVKTVGDIEQAEAEHRQNPGSILLFDWSLNEVDADDLDLLPRWTAVVPKACLISRNRAIAGRGLTSVPASPLLFADLVHAIAVAAGKFNRASVPADFADSSSVTLHQAPTVDEALRAGQLILVAEDNETNRDVLQAQLKRIGYVCELAPDGEQALQMWRSGRYALLLTDCQMPKLDGFGLTAQIRAEETPGKHMPIVAVTAFAMDGQSQRCLDMGMDAYLSKPLSMSALQATLNQWLPLTQVDKLPNWDSTTLTKLVGNQPQLHERLLRKFILNAGEQVQALISAASSADLITVRDKAHTLKSAARSVGALCFGEQCQAMERFASASKLDDCNAVMPNLLSAFDEAKSAIEQHLASA